MHSRGLIQSQFFHKLVYNLDLNRPTHTLQTLLIIMVASHLVIYQLSHGIKTRRCFRFINQVKAKRTQSLCQSIDFQSIHLIISHKIKARTKYSSFLFLINSQVPQVKPSSIFNTFSNSKMNL